MQSKHPNGSMVSKLQLYVHLPLAEGHLAGQHCLNMQDLHGLNYRSIAELSVMSAMFPFSGSSEETLEIFVRDQMGDEVLFHVRQDTTMGRIMLAYCRKKQIYPKSVRFVFEGVCVQPGDTCNSLGMESGYTVDCMIVQQGD
jgi:small ubiquitin-related modifier